MDINQTCDMVHRWAHEKGFYENTCCGKSAGPCRHKSDFLATQLMLIVSECAKAMEADRIQDHCGFCEEIADIAIRVFDLAAANAIDLAEEIERKMEKNRKWEYMHGKDC